MDTLTRMLKWCMDILSGGCGFGLNKQGKSVCVNSPNRKIDPSNNREWTSDFTTASLSINFNCLHGSLHCQVDYRFINIMHQPDRIPTTAQISECGECADAL